MLRRVLTAYLALSMAAAPCLCCCVANQATAAAKEKPAEPPSCCCHKERAESALVGHPSVPDSPERCPCRDHADKQALAEPIAVRNFSSSASFALPATASPVLEAVSIGVNVLVDCGWPYPIPLDMLHFHHRLRC